MGPLTNANFKSKYTVGINLDESQYNLELTGYGYIKYDGVYHFNKSKTFSINSIVEYYSTNDTQLSDKEKAVILALKNSLNK